MRPSSQRTLSITLPRTSGLAHSRACVWTGCTQAARADSVRQGPSSLTTLMRRGTSDERKEELTIS